MVYLLKENKEDSNGEGTMNQPKVYGTFVKRGKNIYRTSAYIQWGDSEKSLGACLLLNPGSASLDKDLSIVLDTTGSASGLIKTVDPTMEQLIHVVEGIYGNNTLITGRFHIYNLFNLQNTRMMHAVDQFEALVNSGEYDTTESLIPLEELQSHPWLLLGWGVEQKARWKNLQLIKEKWRDLISKSKVPTFGKKHKKTDDYYHPCPLNPKQRPIMVSELITLYKQKFAKQRFPTHATKPNLIVEPKRVEICDDPSDGWYRSSGNPESIVAGFSHLRIKNGYKLRAYQYSDGGNGNGIVWAIPVDKELPDPIECERLDGHFLSAPKPPFALPDFMQAIEGDKTPMSYLQASIVFHELHEFGAYGHGTSWRRDVILPLTNNQDSNTTNYEWDMIEDEPDIIEPHFYYSFITVAMAIQSLYSIPSMILER